MKFLLQAEDVDHYLEKIGDNFKIETIKECFDAGMGMYITYDIITLYSINDLVKLQELISAGENEIIDITLSEKVKIKGIGEVEILLLGEFEE
ncbi:hypothetical protein ACSW8L_15740 (plasmid) [Clostridium perfringens]